MSLFIKGITKLSELTIDAAKNWAAKKITNLGAPIDEGDAARLYDVAAANFWQEMLQKEVHLWDDFTHWDEYNSGLAEISRGLTLGNIITASGDDAKGVIFLLPHTRTTAGVVLSGINFDKEIDIQWFATPGTQGTGTDRWTWMRISSGHTSSHLSAKGFGFSHRSSTMYAESWQSELETSASWDTDGNLIQRFRIKHRPDGVAQTEFYQDGVLKATHTSQVPAGTESTAKIAFGAWSDGSVPAIFMGVIRIVFKSETMD